MAKTILIDAWNTFVTENGIFEEMRAMLDEFPNTKIIVTNANVEERIKYGIIDMPYEVFSLDHKPNKTDPEYFKKLLKQFALSSEDVIYFEHNIEAVKSAKSVGIASFHYDMDAKNVNAVREFLKKHI